MATIKECWKQVERLGRAIDDVPDHFSMEGVVEAATRFIKMYPLNSGLLYVRLSSCIKSSGRC